MRGFKGFDKNLKCRDFQFEVGKEYEQKGDIKACSNGFHFCENPMDVFNYYPPSDSRYCEIDGDGKLDKEVDGDSKVACSKLKIGFEIGLHGLIDIGVKFILDKVNWKDNKATNTGDQSAATNTGDQSAATNTGDRSAATNTGDQSAASVEGRESIACGLGIGNRAKGTLGCWIVLAEWEQGEEYNRHIKTVKSAKVDGKNIKKDTWYKLENNKFTEV